MEITTGVLGSKEEFGHEHASQAVPQSSSGTENPPQHGLFNSSDVVLMVS